MEKRSEKEKEALFMVTLDTKFYRKTLDEHISKSNKIDKNLAQSLLDVVDLISNFLDSADVVSDHDVESCSDYENDLATIMPTLENTVMQHRTIVYCRPCRQDLSKSSAKKLSGHFLTSKHFKNLRFFANDIGKIENKSNTNANVLPQIEGSTNSLEDDDDEDTKKEEQQNAKQKQRLNSLPARIKDVVPRDRFPKKMREFLLETNLEKFTMQLFEKGLLVSEKRKHLRVCDILQRKLRGKYPTMKAYAFGSFGIGLGDENSDLDIFIDIENCFYKKLPKRKMKDAIFNIQRILSNTPEWTDFSPVTKARTPILRVFCRSESIDCDLSFSNGLSTCNTALVSYYADLQPLCKKLILFIKYWSNKLNFGVNSYIWTLMVIFYLQQEQKLPPIKVVQDLVQPMLIDGWNSAFGTPTLKQLQIPKLTNFHQTLVGFFKFYGHQFDFTNYIICPLTGTRVPKHIFDHGKELQLPPVFASYVKYMNEIDLEEANEIDDLFANYKPLVIQDPFELIHNVGKGVQELKLMKIIHYMRATLEILTTAQK